MKIFKIILLCLAALIIAGVIGMVIFIKTFDLNTYLPQITKDISSSIGRQVTVGRGTLNISFDGVSLDVSAITVAGDAPGAKPIFTGDRLHAQVSLLPLLLQRKIQSNGITVTGITSDIAQPQPVHISVPELRVQFGAIGMDESFPVTLDLAFASAAKNMHATAQVRWDTKQSKAIIEDFVFRTDLSQLNLAEIQAITPSLAQSPFPTSLKGMLTAKVPHMEAGQKGVEGLNARIELSDGSLAMKELPSPVTGIHLAADVDLVNAYLRELSLTVADGTVKMDGQLKDYPSTAQLTLNAKFDGINIEGLTDVNALPVVIKGKLAGSAAVYGSGLAPELFMKNLKGEGSCVMTGGTIEKLNILKTVLGSTFNVIPGLAEALDSMITGSLKDKLGSDKTSVQKAEAKFTIADEVVKLTSAVAQTSTFEVNASGTVGFDMNTGIQTVFLLDQVLSADLAKKVPQLAYLYDADKQHIRINGQVAGKAPDVKFVPSVEVKNVFQNAIVEEGGKQLQKVIEKNPEVGNVLNALFGGSQTEQGQTQTNAETPVEEDKSQKTKALLNNVLNGFLK